MTSLNLHDIPWPVRESRSLNPWEFIFRDSLGAMSASGVPVTQESALTLAAVYACTRILSTAVASLPLRTLQYSNTLTWQVRQDHYLVPLFSGKVNPYTTSYLWKQHLVTSLCLSGNAYSQIIYNRQKQAIELIQLDASRMKVELVNGEIKYTYSTLNHAPVVIPPDEILHVRWLSLDGITGRSPIQVGADSIGLGLATQAHTNGFFARGATLGPVISQSSSYDSEKSKQFEDAFNAKHQGVASSHLPLYLYGGMTLVPQTINYEQLQLLQLRKFGVVDISRLFGVPAHMLNEMEPGSSKANVEQQALEFATNTLKPLVENIEAELNTTLLTATERNTTRCQFDLDDYTRADFKTRTDGYKSATGGVAWMTANEARAKENLGPIEGGDKLYTVPGSKSTGSKEND